MRRTALLFILLVLNPGILLAQTAITLADFDEAPVIAIDYCENHISVASFAMGRGVVAGDRVLVMQFTGAECDTSDSPAFGSIADLHDAGRYEFATVDKVSGSLIHIRERLLNRYDPAQGHVHLLRVASYAGDATVPAGTLRPIADWAWRLGGVIAVEVSGTLTLQGDLDATGAGFRGLVTGNAEPGAERSYHGSARFGGYKGAGIWPGTISTLTLPYEGLRGPAANGGGGGNAPAGGGAGGANLRSGGSGGGDADSLQPLVVGLRGIGGIGLAGGTPVSIGRVFMGGSGGSGAGLSAPDTVTSGSGGGIVFVRANRIVTTGGRILADGLPGDASHVPGAGATGGGAGGSIIIEATSIAPDLYLSARGGSGGDYVRGSGDAAPGAPGGGGAGGVIGIAGALFPSTVAALVSGGRAGKIIGGDSTQWGGSPYGAAPGEEGIVITGQVVPAGDSGFAQLSVSLTAAAQPCGNRGSTDLTASASGGSPPYRYRWNPAAGLSSDAGPTVAAAPRAPTLYTVEVTDARGCSTEDTITVATTPALWVVLEDGAPVEDIVIDDLHRGTYRCRAITIANRSPRSTVITGATFATATGLSVPPSQFPIVLGPQEQRAIEICAAEREGLALDDTLLVDGECAAAIHVMARIVEDTVEGRDACGNALRATSGAMLRSISEPRPNPAEDHTSIDVAFSDSGLPAPELLDARGQRLRVPWTIESTTAGTARIDLDLREVPSGFYRLSVGVASARLVVVR